MNKLLIATVASIGVLVGGVTVSAAPAMAQYSQRDRDYNRDRDRGDIGDAIADAIRNLGRGARNRDITVVQHSSGRVWDGVEAQCRRYQRNGNFDNLIRVGNRCYVLYLRNR